MSPLDIAFHLLKNNKFHPEDEPMSSDDMISYLDEESSVTILQKHDFLREMSVKYNIQSF